jgi:hypothetical protein
VEISQWYRGFAEQEARGESATYARLALAIADDDELLQRLSALPEPKRQPNLLFASVRYLGGPVSDPAGFRAWALARWDEVAATMLERMTQTNEPGRCAVLLPVLAHLPQPLALLEVGASAGLCLYPDAYGYRYSSHTGVVGRRDSLVQLACEVNGPFEVPEQMPQVVWRAGLDLNPLDVTDQDDMRWLEALIWPEHHERRRRLRAAAAIARIDPPRLVCGDLLNDLPALAVQAPEHATLVVFHSAVLTYVPPQARASFVDVVRGLEGHWVSNEGSRVLPMIPIPETEAQPDGRAPFLLALDGEPMALSGSHGQSLTWFDIS